MKPSNHHHRPCWVSVNSNPAFTQSDQHFTQMQGADKTNINQYSQERYKFNHTAFIELNQRAVVDGSKIVLPDRPAGATFSAPLPGRTAKPITFKANALSPWPRPRKRQIDWDWSMLTLPSKRSRRKASLISAATRQTKWKCQGIRARL
jgi:hypothetical protein